MEPEPVVEPTPAPAPTRPVRAAAQKAADKKAAEAEAAAKKKAESGRGWSSWGGEVGPALLDPRSLHGLSGSRTRGRREPTHRPVWRVCGSQL